MKEIDVVLIELHRLLTEAKDLDASDSLYAQIQIQFVTANRLIKEIDDHVEMEKVRKEADEIAFLAWRVFTGEEFLKGRERLEEFLRLLDIRAKELKN